MTLAFVKTRLLDHEIKLRNESCNTVNKVLHVKTNVQHCKETKYNQQKFKTKKKYFVKCHHCGRKGHMKKNCYYNKRRNQSRPANNPRTVQAVQLTEGKILSNDKLLGLRLCTHVPKRVTK